MNKTLALKIGTVLVTIIIIFVLGALNAKKHFQPCSELDPKYGKYYTALSGFYEGKDMLAIRPGKVTITVLILPDNMPVEVSCKDLIELDVD